MDKLTVFLNSIDWIFLSVILIGGRYWGAKYFRVSKKAALNFLAFATAFGIVYLLLLQIAVGIKKDEVVNMFITYLFTTSFYELLGRAIFERIERFIGGNKQEEASTQDDGGGKGGETPPKPPVNL